MLTYIIPIELFAIVYAIFILMQVFDIKTKDVHVRIKNMLRSVKGQEDEKDDIKPSKTENMLRSGKAKIKQILRSGKTAAIIAVSIASLPIVSNYIPVYTTAVPADIGYIITERIPDTSRLTGVLDIKSLDALSVLRSDSSKGGYVNATSIVGPFSIQLNMDVIAVKENGSRDIFWAQNVIDTETSKDGKPPYYEYHQSEIFKLKSPNYKLLTEILNLKYLNYVIPIKSDRIEGEGHLHRVSSYYNPEISKEISANTYIHSTKPKPLEFPLDTTISVKVGITNGFLVIDFQDLKNGEWKTFDTVRIGKEGEYRLAYIHAGSKNTDAELGIAGGGNGAYAYIRRLNGCMGMFTGDHSQPVRYTYGGVSPQSAERSNAGPISPHQKSGMVEMEAAHK